jgi:hypothetical protein
MKSAVMPWSIVVTRNKIFVQRKVFHETGLEPYGISLNPDYFIANGACHDTPWGPPVVVPKEVTNVSR